MAKQRNFFRGRGTADAVTERDWMTIIDALLQDKNGESQHLVKKMLNKTKHGRLVRMMLLLERKRPTIEGMEKMLKVSRRSIFRYLSGLEEYGVEIELDDNYCYYLSRVPANMKRLLAAAKRRKL